MQCPLMQLSEKADKKHKTLCKDNGEKNYISDAPMSQ